jgi:uncharacterized membrane protein
MRIFHYLNRFLCGLLGVVNILLAVPLAAFVYAVSLDKLTEVVLLNPDVNLTEPTIMTIAVIIAVIAVAVINGNIALSLDKRRFLESLSLSADVAGRGRASVRAATTTVGTSQAPTKPKRPGLTAPKKTRKKQQK